MCQEEVGYSKISSLGDLAGSRREVSFSKNELSLERHQKGLLQSKVGALESQLQTQKKELMELHDNTKERLSSAGQQTRQEVSSLKAKVNSDWEFYTV